MPGPAHATQSTRGTVLAVAPRIGNHFRNFIVRCKRITMSLPASAGVMWQAVAERIASEIEIETKEFSIGNGDIAQECSISSDN